MYLLNAIKAGIAAKRPIAVAIKASEILFGKGTTDSLKDLPEATLLDIFEGVPRSQISKSEIEKGVGIIDFLVVKTAVLPSNGEAKRMLKGGGISINKSNFT